MVRIGIVGLGMMGRTHYEAYSGMSNAQVTCVCDIDPKRAAGDLSGTGGNVIAGGLTQLPMDRIRGMLDYRELIGQRDVDVVDICVPTPLHAEMVVAALDAGKHVISEKPLARTIAQAEQIVAAVARAKRFHMPAMCIRFWPEWAWLKQAIADKRYGAVRSASFRRLTTPLARWFADGKQSGGAVLDLHVHDVDFVQYLFGMPRAVFARGRKGYTGEVDHVYAQYLYDNIPMVAVEGGWELHESFGFQMRYLVNFEHATVDYDLGRAEPLLVYQGGTRVAIPCENKTGYDLELRYFVNCVEKGEKPSVVTAADGLAALKIVDAESRSIASGEVVKL